MEDTKSKKPGGKKEGQKYKPLLVWDILLKKTDENHAIQLKDIKEHLKHYGNAVNSQFSLSKNWNVIFQKRKKCF